MIKRYPGGYYLVFKSNPKFPGDVMLYDIGCDYNTRKVLSFISTEV